MRVSLQCFDISQSSRIANLSCCILFRACSVSTSVQLGPEDQPCTTKNPGAWTLWILNDAMTRQLIRIVVGFEADLWVHPFDGSPCDSHHVNCKEVVRTDWFKRLRPCVYQALTQISHSRSLLHFAKHFVRHGRSLLKWLSRFLTWKRFMSYSYFCFEIDGEGMSRDELVHVDKIHHRILSCMETKKFTFSPLCIWFMTEAILCRITSRRIPGSLGCVAKCTLDHHNNVWMQDIPNDTTRVAWNTIRVLSETSIARWRKTYPSIDRIWKIASNRLIDIDQTSPPSQWCSTVGCTQAGYEV